MPGKTDYSIRSPGMLIMRIMIHQSPNLLHTIFLPPAHLPFIMPLYAPDGLPQAVSLSVQVIGMTAPVFMKDYAGSLLRILCAMQIPVVPGIPALDGHIPVISQNDVEIILIQLLQLSFIKHPHTLLPG